MRVSDDSGIRHAVHERDGGEVHELTVDNAARLNVLCPDT